MLVVETDGCAYHDSNPALRRDHARDLAIELAGWHVLRFGWDEVVGKPDLVTALLRRHLVPPPG